MLHQDDALFSTPQHRVRRSASAEAPLIAQHKNQFFHQRPKREAREVERLVKRQAAVQTCLQNQVTHGAHGLHELARDDH